jgi:hypothetical protein
MNKPERIYDIAYNVADELGFDPSEAPYKFAAEVARRACIQHVEAATEAARTAAKISYDYSDCGNTGSEYPPSPIIDRESISKSYPLTNIR